MKTVMLISFCLATILIFPSAIGSPQKLPDDDYADTDSEEYDEEMEETGWTQPVESKIKNISNSCLCIVTNLNYTIV